MKITSATNPRIKKIVKLKTRKARDMSGLTVVDGIRETQRAFEAGAFFPEVYVCPEILEQHGSKSAVENIASWGMPIIEVNKQVLSKISFGERLEGVVAICKPKLNKIAQLEAGKGSFFVVVENLEKPGNLGAILRTCDGAGVDALIVCDSKIDIYNPNTIRASIGSVFSVPIYQATSNQACTFCKEKSIRILSSSPRGKQAYFTTDMKGSIAIVLGAEDKGLSDFWMLNSDVQVNIPMKGKADSLNVSASAAVLIYEALRQRR